MSDLDVLARQLWQFCYPGRNPEDWQALRPESRQAWRNVAQAQRREAA